VWRPGNEAIGDPAVQFLHMPLSMPTSLAIPLVLPSPLLHHHMTHSHIIISISMEVFAAFFYLFSAFYFSRKKMVGGIISTVFQIITHQFKL